MIVLFCFYFAYFIYVYIYVYDTYLVKYYGKYCNQWISSLFDEKKKHIYYFGLVFRKKKSQNFAFRKNVRAKCEVIYFVRNWTLSGNEEFVSSPSSPLETLFIVYMLPFNLRILAMSSALRFLVRPSSGM